MSPEKRATLAVLQAVNTDFYFTCNHDAPAVMHSHELTVQEGIERWLHVKVLGNNEDHIEPFIAVSLTPFPYNWVVLPISEGYRALKPEEQAIVAAAVLRNHGEDGLEIVERGEAGHCFVV